MSWREGIDPKLLAVLDYHEANIRRFCEHVIDLKPTPGLSGEKLEEETKVTVLQLSKAVPDQYVTVVACFGLYASISKRLHVHAPSDAHYGWYAFNGQIRPFTEKQGIADVNATPVLA